MENDDETQPLIRSPSSTRTHDYLWKYFHLPKAVVGEYLDGERYSWSKNTLLCATVFLEDAVHYQSVNHKVTGYYLKIYRYMSSSLIKRLHQLMLMINLCLAFFEWPSSFSVTSDVRDQPQRVEFPYTFLMIIEGLTLLWFLFYITMKIGCFGLKNSHKRFWMIVCCLVVFYSLSEWFIMFAFFSTLGQGIRIRRILRPVVLIESSLMMRKVFQAVHKNALTIIACISLAFLHILFFATIAMFLFPRSDIRSDSQGSVYFSNLHDTVFQLLVLASTANNPDVMMPAYSDYRLNVLFFIVFVVIGIYCIQNIATAVVYRAFRGYFLNSIVNALLRRRIAVRASFEMLRKSLSHREQWETRDTIPISVVQLVISYASIKRWHYDRINQKLNELVGENERINLEQYAKLMLILDLNPQLSNDILLRPLGSHLADRLRTMGRSTLFDFIGTALAILSILLVTIEVCQRRANADYVELENNTILIVSMNLCLLIYFVFEIIIKIWSFGAENFFQTSWANCLETLVAVTCLILQIIYAVIHRSLIVSSQEIEKPHRERSFISLWAAMKMCNMLFIYRLVRFLPASKNIQIIVGTVVDEIRNGGAFFGVLFSFYYGYSLLGMELFHGDTQHLYERYNQSNVSVCGTYEQLEYWSNGFDDFFSSIITLYNIMVVNQWFVFVNAFRDATQSRWSELYFIIWYVFVTTIGLNICLALSADIHDAKQKRAEQREELIFSNMFDIYRSQLNEPTPEEITQHLYQHPYINFFSNYSESFTFA